MARELNITQEGFHFALRASAANSLPISPTKRVASRSGVRAPFGTDSS
ncbi:MULTISPECIES: hypothetical protein [unclassified Burkholderia]